MQYTAVVQCQVPEEVANMLESLQEMKLDLALQVGEVQCDVAAVVSGGDGVGDMAAVHCGAWSVHCTLHCTCPTLCPKMRTALHCTAQVRRLGQQGEQDSCRQGGQGQGQGRQTKVFTCSLLNPSTFFYKAFCVSKQNSGALLIIITPHASDSHPASTLSPL